MSTIQDLMGVGMSPALASRLGNSPTSLSGTGTTQTGATMITGSSVYLLTPTSSNTAFVLNSAFSTGRPIYLWNQSSTQTALIFPPTGGTINNGSANASVSVAPLSGIIFQLVNGSGVAAENWGALGLSLGDPPVNGLAAPTVFHSGQIGALLGTSGTSTVFVVTDIYLVEVFIPLNTTLTGISVLNGAAATGNVQLSFFNSNGTLLANTASTAQSGTTAYQKIAFTAPLTVLGPAKYYIGLQGNNTAGTCQMFIVGNFGAGLVTGQTYGTVPATVTVPTTFTTLQGPIADTY